MIFKIAVIGLLSFSSAVFAADTTSISSQWGLNQASQQKIPIAIIAVGLTKQDIASMVSVISQSNRPTKIVIQSPDQNIDQLVSALQREFPAISISVQYAN